MHFTIFLNRIQGNFPLKIAKNIMISPPLIASRLSIALQRKQRVQ